MKKKELASVLFPAFFHQFCHSLLDLPSLGAKSLQNDEILDWSKLKAFADDKLKCENQKLKFDMGRVENIVGKGENGGYQHFLLFPTMFSKGLFFRVVKRRDCVVKGHRLGILW